MGRVKHERIEHDHYPTPEPVARAAMREMERRGAFARLPYFAYVLDPGCGDGVWGRAVRATLGTRCCPCVEGIEVRPVEVPVGYDALTIGRYQDFEHARNYHLIVGNPPFSQAAEFVEHARGMLSNQGAMCFLLRLAFLESKARRNFWQANFPDWVAVLESRPAFAHGQTDAQAYALFTWRGGGRAAGKFQATMSILSWKDME